MITSAALLLVIVIGAFSASGITFIKLLGVGMIVALIVDASIVRVLLVPATMRLLWPGQLVCARPAAQAGRQVRHPGGNPRCEERGVRFRLASGPAAGVGPDGV